MPSRRTASKQSKQSTKAVEPEPQAVEQTERADNTLRRLRSKFTRGLRRDKETYDLVHGIVQHLSTSTGTEFETLWQHITERDEKHFQRHFRKMKRENDPFRDIKNAVPAYSFFTKEHNSKLAAQHPDKKFGEISKMVGEMWGKLSDKQKGKYIKMAEADKKRYQQEVDARSRELAQQTTETPVPAPVETVEEPAAETTKSSRSRSGRKSRK